MLIIIGEKRRRWWNILFILIFFQPHIFLKLIPLPSFNQSRSSKLIRKISSKYSWPQSICTIILQPRFSQAEYNKIPTLSSFLQCGSTKTLSYFCLLDLKFKLKVKVWWFIQSYIIDLLLPTLITRVDRRMSFTTMWFMLIERLRFMIMLIGRVI